MLGAKHLATLGVKLQAGLAVKFATQVKFCPMVKVKFRLWRSGKKMPSLRSA